MQNFSMTLAAATLAIAAGTSGALAAPVDAQAAEGMLFEPGGMIFYPVEPKGLGEQALAGVKALQEGMNADQLTMLEMGGYGYYGAMAVPQGDALEQNMLVPVAKLHSPGAAQAAALSVCKTQFSTECTVIGLMLPAGYQQQDLMLSAEATAGFGEKFASGDGPRYLASSPGSNAYAIVKGPGADAVALETCNAATNGKNDCVIAIADE